MAPTDPSSDIHIVELLAERGTAAPHLLAWFAVGLFLVILCGIWRDQCGRQAIARRLRSRSRDGHRISGDGAMPRR